MRITCGRERRGQIAHYNGAAAITGGKLRTVGGKRGDHGIDVVILGVYPDIARDRVQPRTAVASDKGERVAIGTVSNVAHHGRDIGPRDARAAGRGGERHDQDVADEGAAGIGGDREIAAAGVERDPADRAGRVRGLDRLDRKSVV